MLNIGCHLSISRGFDAAARDAVAIGANTFAFFLRNPRGGSAREVPESEFEKCRQILAENDFGTLVAHAPYTLNPCAARPDLREFAVETMIDDLHKLNSLPGNCYNFHPGAHVKQGADIGIQLTAEFLDQVLPEAGTTKVLIETMSGKGSEIGRNFSEVAQIIAKVKDTSKLGVCLDTCHIWDGGYDIVKSLDQVIEEFDHTIGLHRLMAVHLNDSMNPCGSHKDRHARIGEGHIGFEPLLSVITHPKLSHLPFILETPNELPGYAAEIAMFRTRTS